jgi:hypothetical protein
MKKLLLAVAAVLLLASFVFGADASLDRHDLGIIYSGATATFQGCRGCHIPHGGSVQSSPFPNRNTVFGTGADDYSTGANKLWDKNLSTGIYSTYSSDNVNPGGAILGQPATSNSPAWHSYLCFSCHDGLVAQLNLPGNFMSDKAALLMNNGTGDSDLTNDHPVDVSYQSAVTAFPADYETIANVTGGTTTFNTQAMPLYGATSMLECSTCHNPHKQATATNGNRGNFLRIASVSDNTSLCRTCHLSKR